MNGSKRRHGGTRSLLSASRARLVAACVLVFVVDVTSARIGDGMMSKVLSASAETDRESLLSAAENGQVDVVRTLLGGGADVNARNVRDLLLQLPPLSFRSRPYMVFVYIQVCVCSRHALRRCAICD